MTLPVFVSRNGQLITAAEAQVSVFNPALNGSYGVYESLQVVDGVVFTLDEHLQRLAHSAELINLPLPASLSALAQWSQQVLSANNAANAILRIFVLGPENGGESLAFVWPEEPRSYPTDYYTYGVRAITFEGQRTLPQAKTLNTLVSFLAQRQARVAGVHEALLHDHGCITEGSNSNVFAVVHDTLSTAPDVQVLAGVARDVVIRLAEEAGLRCERQEMRLAEVAGWRECFITSTSRHVMPVTTLDGRPVGDGTVGPVTRRVMELFEAHFSETLHHSR